MNIKDFRDAIKRREYVEKVSFGEWAEGIEECCKREVEILEADIESTISFLEMIVLRMNLYGSVK